MKPNEEVAKFFDTVYGNVEGKLVIMTRDEEGNLVSERWWNLPEELSAAKVYSTIRADEDVYVSTAVFTDTIRTKEDLSATANVVYADADTCHPDNFRLPPTISVETSPGRYHAWWVLDDPVLASEASEAAHRISIAHKDQGCDNGWHVSKILRVPGTSNTKDGKTNEVTATYEDVVYTLDTINAAYHDIEVTANVDLNKAMPDKVTKNKVLELEAVIDKENLNSLYLEKPTEGQSWSERLFKLELELFRAGLTAEEVFTLAKNSACNKYAPENAGEVTQTGIKIPKRQNPDKVLWQDVLKAQGEHEATEFVEVETLGSEMRKTEPQTFLTTEEKRYLTDNPTFIDQYTAWVATRTDSAPTYQRTLAWQVLSTVLGDKGYLMPTHSTENLNLWTLVLGDTTSTRKSTALNLYLKVIRKYEELSGDTMLVGSNVTQEGLTKELADRDNMVSVVHTDEINGFFQAAFIKAYQTGILEFFTELYDGTLQKVLRANKDAGNKNTVTVMFNFIGVGIREKTAQILVREHLESGFLARMLWCVADPPKRKKGGDDWIEADDDYSKFSDESLDAIVDDLVDRVRKWHAYDAPVRIKGTPEVNRRHNEWIESTLSTIERMGHHDLLVASTKRLHVSVRKAAALLAMYEQSEVIEMRHLVAAIGQAEAWFNDMVRMSLEVSSTGFERNLTEVENFILGSDNSSGVLDSSVRKKFSKFKPQEQDEIFRALQDQGRIRKKPETRGRWEVL